MYKPRISPSYILIGVIIATSCDKAAVEVQPEQKPIARTNNEAQRFIEVHELGKKITKTQQID